MAAFPDWWPHPQEGSPPPDGAGIWASLERTLDFKASKPRQAWGVISKEMVDGSGRHFMLKNGGTHTYARLSPEEFWIWQKFNGETSVQQIVHAYFLEFQSFAFGAITGLLERLRELNMLEERPYHLYSGIAHELKAHTLFHKLTWIARAAFSREWVIKGLDAHLDRIYRFGGWALFSLPVQILFFLVSVFGTILFFHISRQPQYDLLGGSPSGNMVTLGLLAYIPLLIHEFGHAITAKHAGCDVYKGGIMLYYGIPAAFVDTTDVWMVGKRARLAVTWAGPYTGYILSGLAALVVYSWHSLPVQTATHILQAGLIGFVTGTINILPLVKLDGYYILADWLEIPRLRERSLAFVTRGLVRKLAGREKWVREERIFFIYGLVAVASTVYFAYSGFRYWDSKTVHSVSTLLQFDGGYLAALTNAGTIFLAVSSIAYSVYLLGAHGSTLIARLRKVGLFSHRGRAALVLAAGAGITAVLPPLLLPGLSRWLMHGLGFISFGAAAWMSFKNFRAMRGSVHVWMWAAGAIGFASGAASYAGEIPVGWIPPGTNLLELGLLISAMMFVLSGRLLLGLYGSWRFTSLALIASGIAAGIAGPRMGVPDLKTFAGLLVASGLLHWNMLPAHGIEKTARGSSEESTRGQIVEVFRQLKQAILETFEADFGLRSRRWVEDGAYLKADTVFEMQQGEAPGFASTITGMTPDDYGAAMAFVLKDLLAGIERAAGRKYAVRALAYGFDSLDWEQQEITEDHLLKYVPHAQGLSQMLDETRHDVQSLLRSVPLFMSMSSKDIESLSKQLRTRQFSRGEMIVEQGREGDAFYIIRAGSVEVVRSFDPIQGQEPGDNAVLMGDIHQVMIIARNRKLNTLGRGDYFGEGALLTGRNRSASVRAVTPVEVFWLDRDAFRKFVSNRFGRYDATPASLRRLSTLRQVPPFSEFEGSELKLLEENLETIHAAPGEVIVRYGEAGSYLYVIESGKVCVRVPYRNADGAEKLADRASLGSGEYFGEIALLNHAPRSATVVAAEPTVLLRLDAGSFNELLERSSAMKHTLERTSSRRTLSNANWRRPLPEA